VNRRCNERNAVPTRLSRVERSLKLGGAADYFAEEPGPHRGRRRDSRFCAIVLEIIDERGMRERVSCGATIYGTFTSLISSPPRDRRPIVEEAKREKHGLLGLVVDGIYSVSDDTR